MDKCRVNEAFRGWNEELNCCGASLIIAGISIKQKRQKKIAEHAKFLAPQRNPKMCHPSLIPPNRSHSLVLHDVKKNTNR